LRGASTFESVSGRPRHAGLETCEPKLGWPTAGWEACATTIGRANPKIAGSRPCGIHARRRAWARLTRRQPPHARARALPETNPAANGCSPIPLEIAKNLGCERNRLTNSHSQDSLAVRSGAGTPAGVPEAAGLDSGGIAALNHRLQAGIPPG